MPQYEVKNTTPAQVSTNADDNTVTITQGFTTGVVGVPEEYGMVAGDTLTVIIDNSKNKTQEELEADVMAAVAAFVEEKYPNT